MLPYSSQRLAWLLLLSECVVEVLTVSAFLLLVVIVIS